MWIGKERLKVKNAEEKSESALKWPGEDRTVLLKTREVKIEKDRRFRGNVAYQLVDGTTLSRKSYSKLQQTSSIQNEKARKFNRNKN